MDTAGVKDALGQLGGHLKDLDKTLQPLLTSALSDTTKKLPLLDRAKLYVTICYTIESLLFSYLTLHGIKAKEHQVFTELQRVKQYFAKIKDAELGSTTQTERKEITLNKQAAGRIVKHALAGNKKFDADLAARKAEELAVIKKKLAELEEKKRLKEERMAKSAASSSPTVSSLNGSSQSAGALPEEVVAQMEVEEGEIEGDDAMEITDPQTPQSVATSELTDSSKTSKKGKKRYRKDKSTDLSRAKKRK